MSKYVRVATQIKDEGLFVQALKEACQELNIQFEQGESLSLFGYRGGQRRETAEYVIRRRHVGISANDLGFHRCADGAIEAIISEYDQRNRGQTILNEVRQRYAVKAVTKAAWAKGLSITRQESKGGEIRLQVRAYR